MRRSPLRAGAAEIGAALLFVGLGLTPAGAQSPPAPVPDIRCSPGATTLHPLAAMTRIAAPTGMDRVSGRLTVSGTVRMAPSRLPLYIAVKDPSGGTMTEGFLAGGAEDGGDYTFTRTFDVPIIQETLACVWVVVAGPELEEIQGQFLALVPVTIVPAPGPPATNFRPSPFFIENTGPDLIVATMAYVEGTGRATVPIVVAQIVRAVKNWAAVRIFPSPGTTDPATVIMTRPDPASATNDGADTGWRGVTFGTGALCLDSDQGIPPILCDYALQYAGEDEQHAVAAIDALHGRKTYRNGFIFDYSADGRVFEPAVDPFAVRVQRFLTGDAASTFSGMVYGIRVQPIAAGPGTVDSWAYSRMVAETTDLTLCPVTGTYFETGDNAVFQVDCVEAAGLIRRFYVTPKGQEGGIALLVRTTIAPEGLSPWQPEADAVLALVLKTVRLGGD